MLDETISMLESQFDARNQQDAANEILRDALVQENKKLHKQLTALEKKAAALEETRKELRATSLKLREHQKLLVKQVKKK